MDSKNNKIEIMINDTADEVIGELLQSRLSSYRIGLETSMKYTEFVFDFVHLLYYKYHKINPNQSGSYLKTLNWIKNKKAAINHINEKDDICF